VHLNASALIAADDAAQAEEGSRRAREAEWESEGGRVPAPSAAAAHTVAAHAVGAQQRVTAPARSFGA
jgi:hypothetical protein